MAVAIIHVFAHVGGNAVTFAVRLSLARKVAFIYHVLDELHRGVRLVGRDHVASLRHDDRSEIVVVSVPSTDLLRAIKLVKVLVDFARL